MTERRTPDVSEALELYRAISRDYDPNPGIFNADPDRLRRVKWIVAYELAAADRAIIRLYAETGSLRKLARLLGISRGSAAKEVERIRRIIFDKYNEIVYEHIRRNSPAGRGDGVRRGPERVD